MRNDAPLICTIKQEMAASELTRDVAPSLWVEAAIDPDSHARLLELFIGVDDAGRDTYCYIAIRPSQYTNYRTGLVSSDSINLEDYGEILFLGYGSFPPPDIIKQMSEIYNFDHTYDLRLQEDQDKLTNTKENI